MSDSSDSEQNSSLFDAPCPVSVTVPPVIQSSLSIKQDQSAHSEEEDVPSEPVPEKTSTPSKPKIKTFTVIIKNVPISLTKKDILKLCPVKPHSMRFRSVPVNRTKVKEGAKSEVLLPKKVAIRNNSLAENRSSMHCYLEFLNEQDADSCCTRLHLTVSRDHTLFVHPESLDLSLEPKKAVFVGNLSPQTDEESLFRLFSNAGKVRDVRVCRNKDSTECIGTAFIHFYDEASTLPALKLDGSKVLNRNIRVSKCLSKEQQQRRKNVAASKQRLAKAKKGRIGEEKEERRGKHGGMEAAPGIIRYKFKPKVIHGSKNKNRNKR
ncbi:hypothetical protein P9112_003500 [Eukaryota sp. TZLM1-RC]